MPLEPDMFAPRYTQIPTFMRAPFVEDPTGVDIAIVGVPYDGALTNRPGARHGPREIRNQSSLMRRINHATRIDPYARCRVADVGDVPFTRVFDIEAAHAEITAFVRRVHDAGARPLVVGGDHSITLPVFRAIAAGRPIGMVHVDSHTDTWDEFLGSKFNHGTPFRRAVEEGLLDPRRTIQIGIRGAQNVPEGWDYSRDSGMRVLFIEEFADLGVPRVLEEIRRVVGAGPTYVSFDIDGLDPVYAPGTGTPEIGGITPREAQALIRGLGGLDLVGADVVEVSPPFDVGGITALTAATVAYELLCVLAAARTA